MSSIGPQIPPHLFSHSQFNEEENNSEDSGSEQPEPSTSTSASIGPQIPLHLLRQSNNADEGENYSDDNNGPQPSVNIGAQIPAHLLNNAKVKKGLGSKLQVLDEDDDFGPRPPTMGPNIGPTMPASVSRWSAGPSMPPLSSRNDSGRRVIGPSFPSSFIQQYDNDDDDDDDIGPKPLPAALQGQYQYSDAVQEFMEREEKMRKAVEEAAKPKAPKREEWMLVPPTSSGLLGNLDPTKIKKGRTFNKGSSAPVNTAKDMSLWTETPAERQQRLADEVSGKKRRVTDTIADNEDEGEKLKKKRRKEEEESIRKGVEEHTRKARGAALVDQHTSSLSKSQDKDKEPPVIWDHARDMGLGGRLMDDDKRSKMVKEAKGLGDRFGSGSRGGFL